MTFVDLKKVFVFAAVFCGLAAAAATPDAIKSKAERRAISLFNVVQFSNEACSSTSSIVGGSAGNRRNGTCFTKDECADKGGVSAGNCAAGFGVCCVFTITATGSDVTQNCTYIQNPGFPSTTTDSTALSYTIRKCDPCVCKFRLDFETFTLAGPAESELLGGACQNDQFTVATTNNAGPIPTICGENSGQHIYIDVGTGNSDTATLNFAFTGNTARAFDIKVSQISCGTNYNAPDGCFQYFTGVSGQITSFNYAGADGHLASQSYTSCVRPERGYCCVEYSACSDADSFELNPGVAAAQSGDRDIDCVINDFVEIEASSAVCGAVGRNGINGEVTSRYCGNRLSPSPGATVSSPVCDCTAPFAVHFEFDAFSDVDSTASGVNTIASRGVCLNYRQILC